MTADGERFDATAPLEPGTIVLEASAGTGKTYTIASLVVRLVAAEGVPLREILVVTFTEAATAELRDRIRERLVLARRAFRGDSAGDDPLLERLLADPDVVSAAPARLDAAIAGFDEAMISTIHGFCHRVLSEHAFESGVTYDTELVSDLRPLLSDVVQDVWTDQTFDVSPEWLELVSNMSVASLERFAGFVCRALDVEIEPEVEDGAERCAELVSEIRALGPDEHAAALGMLQAAVDGGGMHADFIRHFSARSSSLQEWLTRAGRDSFGLPPEDAEHFTPTKLSKKTKVDWKKAHGVPSHLLFDRLEELFAQRDPTLLALRRRLVDLFRERLDTRKRARGVWSFDDLLERLRCAVAGAAGAPLRDRLRARYRAVLIDEFQDTDAVQWQIFRDTFPRDDGWLCLIGDPKQAIYKFRGGDVYTYLSARKHATRRATLGKNWRSDPRFVRAVNTVFKGPNDEFVPFLEPRVPFDPVEAEMKDRLRFAGKTGAALRIAVFREADGAADDAAEADRKATGKGEFEDELAARVASAIVRLLNDEAVTIGGAPVVPKDVAVLTRTNQQARAVQHELQQRRVPSILHGDSSVFSTPEATDLRRVLEAVQDPSRETLVKAALATDLLGESAAEIERLSTTDANDWIDLLGELKVLRGRWDESGVVAMLHRLFAVRGVVARTLGLLGGERRMTNVVHLIELLHRAGREERLGPAALIRWLARQIEREADGGYTDREAAQVRLESDADAVQIATVHRSKGLEYPIVFAPWLWSGRQGPTRKDWYLDAHRPEDGDRHVLDLRGSADEDAKRRSHQEEREEELRLAYVALTRARHLCVVHHGRVNQLENSPLGHLLHSGGVSDDASFRSDLDALEARSDGTIEVVDDVGVDPAAYLPSKPDREELSAAVLGRRLDRAFRTSSFSALVRGHEVASGSPEEAGAEQADPAHEPSGAKSDGERVPLAEFVRGTRAGRFLHRVLETADFRVPARAALTAEVERWRRSYAVPAAVPSSSIADALGLALDAPLSESGLRLAVVPPERRWNELAFLFPVAPDGGKMEAADLARAVRECGPPAVPAELADRIESLGFAPLRGFLKGYIDLVYCDGAGDDGRFWVVDFKSNFLGPRYGDYEDEALRGAMRDHDYDLQALLYVVAVHRFLRLRRPGYDPARHLGGARYLFLRGMSPAHPGRGVVEVAPSVALIARLDEVLAHPGGAS